MICCCCVCCEMAAQPKYLGEVAAYTDDSVSKGLLADYLEGAGPFLQAVLHQYGADQLRAYVTRQGGLRLKVLADIQYGPPAVQDGQNGWVLDISLNSGDARDWNKLLNTSLGAWPQPPGEPAKWQAPPQRQVLHIQQAAAASIWQFARHIKAQEADLQELCSPAAAAGAGSSQQPQPAAIAELLQTVNCAFYSRLLWHLSNKFRPSARELQEHAGSLGPASLWCLVAAPPYAQHAAAVRSKEWSTDVCSLVALLHELQLLEVGNGRRLDVLGALHKLLQMATTPPEQLPAPEQEQEQEQRLSKQQSLAVKAWLSSYGVQLQDVLTAAAAPDLPANIGICCYCGDVEDKTHNPPTPLVPCRSCVHEYHVGCCSSEGSRQLNPFALAPDRKQLRPGPDGKGTCLACQGFPLSGQCWQLVYEEQQEQQEQPNTAGTPAAAAAAAAGNTGGRNGSARSPAHRKTAAAAAAAAATPPKKKKQRVQGGSSAAAAAAAGDASPAPSEPPAAGDEDADADGDEGLDAVLQEVLQDAQGWEYPDEDLPPPEDPTQGPEGSLVPTLDLQQDSGGGGGDDAVAAAAAAAAAAAESQGGSGGAGGSGRGVSSRRKRDDSKSSDSKGDGSSGSDSSSSESSSSSSGESSTSSSSSDDSDDSSSESGSQPPGNKKQQQQQQQQRKLRNGNQKPVQQPRKAPPREQGGNSTAATGSKVAAAAATAGTAPAAKRRGQPPKNAPAAAAPAAAAAGPSTQAAAAGPSTQAGAGPAVKRRGRPPNNPPAAPAPPAAAADADAVQNGPASPVRSRRAAAATAAAAIAAQAAADQHKGVMGSPGKKRQQAAAAADHTPPGRLSRAAIAAVAAAAAAAGDTPHASNGSQPFSATEAADALLAMFADLDKHKQQTQQQLAAGNGEDGALAAAQGGNGTLPDKAAGGGGGDTRTRQGRQQAKLVAEGAAAAAAGEGRQGVKRGRQAAANAAATGDGDKAGDAGAAGEGDRADEEAGAAGPPAAKRPRGAALKASQQQQQQVEAGQGEQQMGDQQSASPEPRAGADPWGWDLHPQQARGPVGLQGAARQPTQLQAAQQQQRQQQQVQLTEDGDVLLRLRRLSLLLLSSGEHRPLQRQMLRLLGEGAGGAAKLTAATLLALFAPAAGQSGGAAAASAAQALAANAAAVLNGSKTAAAVCLGDPPVTATAAAAGPSRRVSVGSEAARQVLQGWDWEGLSAAGVVSSLVALLDAQVQLVDAATAVDSSSAAGAADCAGACLAAVASVFYRAAADKDQEDGRVDLQQNNGRGGGRQAAAGSNGQQQQQGLLGLRREVLLQVLLTAREVLFQLHQAGPAGNSSLTGQAAAAAGSSAAADLGPVCSFGDFAVQLVSAAALAVAEGASSAADLQRCKDTCQQLLALSDALAAGPAQQGPQLQLLLTDWHLVRRALLTGEGSGWDHRASVLQGLLGLLRSGAGAAAAPAAAPADRDSDSDGREGTSDAVEGQAGGGPERLNLQVLPTGMAEQLLQVLGAAGKLSAIAARQEQGQEQHAGDNGQQGGGGADVAVQERQAGVQQGLPVLYALLRDVLRRLGAAEGQHQQLLAGTVLLARQALHMAGSVLGVLLLPDDSLRDFVLELRLSVGKGVVDSTVGVVSGVVQPEVDAGCYYNASEAMAWWAADAERAVRRATAG